MRKQRRGTAEFSDFSDALRTRDIGFHFNPVDWDAEVLDSLADFNMDDLLRDLQDSDWGLETEQSAEQVVQEALTSEWPPMTEEEMRRQIDALLESTLAEVHAYEREYGPLVPLRRGGRVRRNCPDVLRLRFTKRILMDAGLWREDGAFNEIGRFNAQA